MAVNHPICDACENVSHCSTHGCIPLEPAAVATDLLEEHDRFAAALTRIAALGGEAGQIAREALEGLA